MSKILDLIKQQDKEIALEHELLPILRNYDSKTVVLVLLELVKRRLK